MKTAGAALVTHIEGEELTIKTLVRITLLNGTKYHLTDHDQEITIDVENPAAPVDPQIYRVSPGGYTLTPTRLSSGLSVNSVNFESEVDRTAGLDERDVRAGLWDHATVELFTVNYKVIADGIIKESKGRFGELSLLDEITQTELRGLTQLLSQVIGEVVQPSCLARFGDGRCKVELEPTDWAVTTVYVVGDRVSAALFDARKYRCTVAGTSGASEPTFDTTIGNTTVDATVTWTTEEAFSFEDSVLSITDQRKFNIAITGETPVSPAAQATGAFAAGLLTWLTGANTGISEEVRNWTYTNGGATATMAGGPNVDFNDNDPAADVIHRDDAGSFVTDGFTVGMRITVGSSTSDNGDYIVTVVTASDLTLRADSGLSGVQNDAGVTIVGDQILKEVELDKAMIFPIVPGDTFIFYVGCDLTRTACIFFDNIENFRGFPDLPGHNAMIRRPDQPGALSSGLPSQLAR